MILSLSQLYFKDRDFDASEVKRAGFDTAEVSGDTIISEIENNFQNQTFEKFSVFNLEGGSLHAPFRDIDISSDDEWTRVKSVREVEKSIVIASRLKCKYLTVHPSKLLKPEEINEKRVLSSLKSFFELQESAEFFGIEILAENMLPDRLMNSYECIDRYLEKGVNLCFDIGHAFVSGIIPVDFAKKYSDRIKVLHIHFNDGIKDEHRFCESDTEFEVLKSVYKILNKNVISVVEIKNLNYDLAVIASKMRSL